MSEVTTYAQTYLPLFRAYQDEMLQRLGLLVNITSGSGQITGVNRVIEHLSQWLRELDYVVTFHPTELFGDNLVARRQGKGQKRILVVGHVDTVYGPAAVLERPFAILDGRAYGPGVIDMKSGVVMGLYALRALIETGFDQYGELVVLFNNDEEVGSPGSAPLLRELAHQVDAGLVLEPSGSSSVLTQARKGTDHYVLEVTGVAAHSGAEPDKGRSAVVELAYKILAMQNLHAQLPGVTFNITRLSSTEPLNIVPDMARCHISVRAHTERGLNFAAEALEHVAANSNVAGTHTMLTRMRGRQPYKATPEIARLVEFARLEGEALGLQLVPETKSGVSDANNLVHAGVPTLDGLGPIGGGLHNLSREYLRIDSLPIRGALLAGLIQHICLQ